MHFGHSFLTTQNKGTIHCVESEEQICPLHVTGTVLDKMKLYKRPINA